MSDVESVVTELQDHLCGLCMRFATRGAKGTRGAERTREMNGQEKHVKPIFC